MVFQIYTIQCDEQYCHLHVIKCFNRLYVVYNILYDIVLKKKQDHNINTTLNWSDVEPDVDEAVLSYIMVSLEVQK